MSPCIHVSMSSCLHVFMSSCLHVFMSSCLHVFMSPCLHVSMYPCIHVSMSPCLHASMSPFPQVSMSPCLHFFTFPEFSKRKTEQMETELTENGKLPCVYCKRKRKTDFCFLGRPTANGNRRLLFQQMCPSMEVSSRSKQQKIAAEVNRRS